MSYQLAGFGFAGTVPRRRADRIRAHWTIASGDKITPTKTWVEQLGYCGDKRYCLKKVEFTEYIPGSPIQLLVKFRMAKRKKP